MSSNIRKTPDRLSKTAVATLKKELAENEAHYDKEQGLLWTVTKEKHYHSDLDSGVRVHDTRASVQYAAALLRTDDTVLVQRGITILKNILPLQEKDSREPFCGVWPYYPEDPLKGRKAPVDYNWADFMAVSLTDIVLNASEHLNRDLKQQVREALILAARAIQKRDVKADYTNICIMGTYVCYVVGDLYRIPDISNYARNRLAYFYQYTKDNKGFTEYNSPTYTVVAMNELLRMKQVITNPEDKRKVEELYKLCWRMIARHFHAPSGQWCGPNLRAYSNLLTPDLKRLLFTASGGKIVLPGTYLKDPDVLVPHQIPSAMIPAFLHQELPRTETDTFTMGRLQPKNTVRYADGEAVMARDIVGTLYAHPQYALASVNQGYLWNQCRPLIAHWGTAEKPVCLRVRFLHDFYDFSAVHIKSMQDTATVLSILNVAYNGGDKHPGIDRIKDATISAADLRVRIEVGGAVAASGFSVTDPVKKEILLKSGLVQARIGIPYINWDGLPEGHWEFGGTEDQQWADYVIYSGRRKTFNLAAMKEAVIGLSLSMAADNASIKVPPVTVTADHKYLRLSSNNSYVKALKKPDEEFRIKNDFEINSK
ncbi:hypothetical protein [Niabella ginsenosidivorans]|uniref:hypothetical protein n=1 Tax=Niabella ginsenosidivorans TaxID=1176587 RepID=UPI001471897C|nr:hypothetical protein [Niabella ginsenosidivorans]